MKEYWVSIKMIWMNVETKLESGTTLICKHSLVKVPFIEMWVSSFSSSFKFPRCITKKDRGEAFDQLVLNIWIYANAQSSCFWTLGDVWCFYKTFSVQSQVFQIYLTFCWSQHFSLTDLGGMHYLAKNANWEFFVPYQMISNAFNNIDLKTYWHHSSLGQAPSK